MDAELVFIGTIETPYQRIEDCPRNIDPSGPECRIHVSDRFADGLLGLKPGRKILILYWFDADRSRLRTHSRKSGEYAGVFALRSPHRPNPIGAAVLPIAAVERSTLIVRGLDCRNGTPLIDIKPEMCEERFPPKD